MSPTMDITTPTTESVPPYRRVQPAPSTPNAPTSDEKQTQSQGPKAPETPKSLPPHLRRSRQPSSKNESAEVAALTSDKSAVSTSNTATPRLRRKWKYTVNTDAPNVKSPPSEKLQTSSKTAELLSPAFQPTSLTGAVAPNLSKGIHQAPGRSPSNRNPSSAQTHSAISAASNKPAASMKTASDSRGPGANSSRATAVTGFDKKPAREHALLRVSTADDSGSLSKVTSPSTALDTHRSLSNLNSLREKLSARGVQVSDPQAPINGNRATGDSDQSEHMPKPKKTTPVANNPNNDGRTNHQRARGTARGRGGKHWKSAPRDSTWLRNKDIPKGDPKRFETTSKDWMSELDSVASNSAYAGFGHSNKRQHRADSDTEYQLAGWDGNWAPAPVDWDARPAFRANQSSAKIESWMETIEEELCGKDRSMPSMDLTSPADHTLYFAPDPNQPELQIQGDPTPRYWIPVIIGNQAPLGFWTGLVDSKEPAPFDDGDLDDVRPWWECFALPGNTSCNFLRPYDAPHISGVDPDETQNERLARENDMGSTQHTANRKRLERAKREAKRERHVKAKEKARKLNAFGPPLAAPTPKIKPGLPIYIRTARPSDIKEIRQIYNHYVDNSVSTPEMDRRTDADMLQRLQDVRTNKLPFLVACERGSRLRAKRHGNGEDIVLPDTVVGFALADDFSDLMGMYRFTVEAEVYTDKRAYMKGVAKCLFDKLIALLDPCVMEKGGYEVQGADIDGIGGERTVQHIVVHFPYERTERLEWVTRWLTNSYGFRMVGDMQGVGIKLGKSVNLAIFQRTSDGILDPANPPIPMNYPPPQKL